VPREALSKVLGPMGAVRSQTLTPETWEDEELAVMEFEGFWKRAEKPSWRAWREYWWEERKMSRPSLLEP